MKLGLGIFGLLLATNGWAASSSYVIDSRHTFPVFEVSHYGFSLQRGRFGKVTGTLVLDHETNRGSIEVVIDTASIDMGFDEWSKQMRGERFFQVEKFPSATFVARDFALVADRPSMVAGELSLLGTTRPVLVEVTRWRCARHPMLPRELCGADIQATIRRSEFGMGYGTPGIADEVRLAIPIEAIREQ